MYWWPFAITTGGRTWSAFYARPTRARWTSWFSPSGWLRRPARVNIPSTPIRSFRRMKPPCSPAWWRWRKRQASTHPPRLWPEDIALAHRLWLELSAKGPGSKLHHRDIIGVALRRMNAELHSARAPEVVADIQRECAGGNHSSL